MTWSYTINDSGELEVYDHNGDLNTTLQNDGRGFRLPDDVLQAMGDTLDSEGWDLSSSWVRSTIKDALVEDIEER